MVVVIVLCFSLTIVLYKSSIGAVVMMLCDCGQCIVLWWMLNMSYCQVVLSRPSAERAFFIKIDYYVVVFGALFTGRVLL